MKSKHFEVLHRLLLPHLPAGYASQGTLLFMKPIQCILRGFYFEPSGFDPSGFYLWAFLLPLYVPNSYISFTFGKRIGGGKLWNVQKEKNLIGDLLVHIKSEGIPFLNQGDTPERLAEMAAALMSDGLKDPYVQEAIAYSLIYAGQPVKALESIDDLCATLENMHHISWTRELLDRARELRAYLLQEPDKAKKRLEAWRDYSLANLCLTRFG